MQLLPLFRVKHAYVSLFIVYHSDNTNRLPAKFISSYSPARRSLLDWCLPYTLCGATASFPSAPALSVIDILLLQRLARRAVFKTVPSSGGEIINIWLSGETHHLGKYVMFVITLKLHSPMEAYKFQKPHF